MTEAKNDGGAAFPLGCVLASTENCKTCPSTKCSVDGMSLRAYMAIKFHAALLSSPKITRYKGEPVELTDEIARAALREADALLKELNK